MSGILNFPDGLSKKDLKLSLQMSLLAEAVHALKEVPSGHLYARCMNAMSIHEYNACIAGLVRSKLVRQDGNHLLTWIGPNLTAVTEGATQMAKKNTTDATPTEKKSRKPSGSGKTSGSKSAKKVSQDPEKVVDTTPTQAVDSIDNTLEQAIPQAPATESKQENKTMTLTFKSLGRNGRYAFYAGTVTPIRIPLSNFADPKNLPASFEVADGALLPAKQPKVKMTAEERKAANAAKPKLTLAEKIAKQEAKLEADRQKLAKEQAAAATSTTGGDAAQASM